MCFHQLFKFQHSDSLNIQNKVNTLKELLRSVLPWPLTFSHQNIIILFLSHSGQLLLIWRNSLKKFLSYCNIDIWKTRTDGQTSVLCWLLQCYASNLGFYSALHLYSPKRLHSHTQYIELKGFLEWNKIVVIRTPTISFLISNPFICHIWNRWGNISSTLVGRKHPHYPKAQP